MSDPRIQDYARLLVEECLDIEPGAQVLVVGSPLARPLLEEVLRVLARKGAYALLRMTFGGSAGLSFTWAAEAPLQLLEELAPAERHVFATVDAIVAVEAPENTREASAIDSQRLQLIQKGFRPALQRVISGDLPWVGCQFPCPALAQEAGMSLREFEDFLYGACLLDWGAERERMQRYADRFDAADQVRIVGAGTDLTLSLAGRRGKVDAAGANIPGGEFYFCPVEDSAEGTIEFGEFPAVYAGREVAGIRLRFEAGRVVDAAATQGEEFLLEVLDTDEGARRLGELGIGCNPGIQRYMKNTLFDEKIDGTVHVALGTAFPDLGGTNESAIHWDLVKDLRGEGRIELDGELVQDGGAWRI